MTGWMLDQAAGWLLDFVRSTLDLVWTLLAVTLFHLPDVSAMPQVVAMNARSLHIVNTAYVLVVMACALAVMASPTLQTRYGVGELAPRLVIGLVAANFAPAISRTVIASANALVMALTGQGIASEATMAHLLRLITAPMRQPGSALLMALIGLVLIVIVLKLIAGWITRFIALIVLCGLAPVALACHGTPWTDVVARLWWQALAALVASVVLQAVALNTALSILLDPRANLRPYGFPADPSGLLNLFVIACLLWMTARIPSLVHRNLSRNGNRQNVVAAMVRLVVVQQLTRGLRLPLGRRRALGALGAHRTEPGQHITGRPTAGPLRGFASAAPLPPAPGAAGQNPRSRGPGGPGMSPGPWPAHRTGTGWPGSPAGPRAGPNTPPSPARNRPPTTRRTP